jgi:hypothetical protein
LRSCSGLGSIGRGPVRHRAASLLTHGCWASSLMIIRNTYICRARPGQVKNSTPAPPAAAFFAPWSALCPGLCRSAAPCPLSPLWLLSLSPSSICSLATSLARGCASWMSQYCFHSTLATCGVQEAWAQTHTRHATARMPVPVEIPVHNNLTART